MEKKATPTSVRITAYAIFALLLLFIFILIAELYARSQTEYGRVGFVFSKDMIYTLNPNLVAQKEYASGQVGKPPFTLTFNDQGFRGDDFSKSVPENATRILVLGDSYTAGLDYPDGVVFSDQWAQRLNENSENKYEVLNASCPAWGTDQEYLFWKTEGQYLQPAQVVIMISPNDVRESWNHNIVRFNTSTGKIDVKEPTLAFKERWGWKLASKSSFFQLLQQKVWETTYGDFARVFWHFPVNYGVEDSTDWDRPLFLKEQLPAVEDSYALMEKLYVEIKEDCERIGAELHLVKISIRMEI